MKKQEIRARFRKQISIENYSEQTIKNYLSVLKLFLEWVEDAKVKEVTNTEIQDYLFYCKKEKNYSYSTMKQVIATISFLYGKVLHKPIHEALDIKLRKPIHLPTVLSIKDISKILEVTSNLKYETILMLIYSGGLCLGELIKFKIGDIDSEAMKIHIRIAKGKKDWYIMLSENVLALSRGYYKLINPKITYLKDKRVTSIVHKVYSLF